MCKVISNLESRDEAHKIYQIMQNEQEYDLYNNTSLCTSIISMFGRCGDIKTANQIWHHLMTNHKNTLSVSMCNIVMNVNIHCGQFKEAIICFEEYYLLSLKKQTKTLNQLKPNNVTYAKCAFAVKCIKSIHYALKIYDILLRESPNLLKEDESLRMQFIEMFLACNHVQNALSLIDGDKLSEMQSKALWKYMHKLIKNEEYENALNVFYAMIDCNLSPDAFTFSLISKAIAKLERSESANKIYKMVQSNLDNIDMSDDILWSSLIFMFSKCQNVVSMNEVWTKYHSKKGWKSWENIIEGNFSNENYKNVLLLFDEYVQKGGEEKRIFYLRAIQCCAYLNDEEKGNEIFANLKQSECDKHSVYGFIQIKSALIAMFGCFGQIEKAESVWNEIDDDAKHVTVYNVMMKVYVDNGQRMKVFALFDEMQNVRFIDPISTTYVLLLRACDNVQLVDAVCANILCDDNVHVLNSDAVIIALVETYAEFAKIEALEHLWKIYRERSKEEKTQNEHVWKSVICVYAKYDLMDKAVDLYQELRQINCEKADFVYNSCSKLQD